MDAHPAVRQGLAFVLEQEGFAVCGEAGSIQEARRHPKLALANLVVMDALSDERSGLDLLGELHARQIKTLVFSVDEDPSPVRQALAAGADGYVAKRETARCLLDAVRSVLAGKVYVSLRVDALCCHADSRGQQTTKGKTNGSAA